MTSHRVLAAWGQFSLLELATCMGIVMTLTALALPAMQQFHLRAARSEMPVLLDGLYTAQCLYQEAEGKFLVEQGPYPSAPATRQARPYPEGSSFESQLGWRPDGEVRAIYYEGITWALTVPMMGLPRNGSNLRLYAQADLDGDGATSVYYASAVPAWDYWQKPELVTPIDQY